MLGKQKDRPTEFQLRQKDRVQSERQALRVAVQSKRGLRAFFYCKSRFATGKTGPQSCHATRKTDPQSFNSNIKTGPPELLCKQKDRPTEF